MTELTCEQARDLAPEYGLGILEPDERAAMAAHVLRCPECRRETEEFARLGDDLMEVIPAAEPPPGFDGRVLASLQAPRRTSAQTSSGHRRRCSRSGSGHRDGPRPHFERPPSAEHPGRSRGVRPPRRIVLHRRKADLSVDDGRSPRHVRHRLVPDRRSRRQTRHARQLRRGERQRLVGDARACRARTDLVRTAGRGGRPDPRSGDRQVVSLRRRRGCRR